MGHILRIQKWGPLNDKIQKVAMGYPGPEGLATLELRRLA